MKFSRRAELKTILPFVMILQRKIIPGENDIFPGFFPGGVFACLPIFQGYIKQSKILNPSLCMVIFLE